LSRDAALTLLTVLCTALCPRSSFVCTLQALSAVEDVGARPGFYAKIAAYGVGAIVGVTVLNAVVSAVDSLPVLPGFLELVGLGCKFLAVLMHLTF
jgi:hypothetical protein